MDQNHALNPLEKCRFFDFLKLLFFIYSLEGRFFVLEYRKTHFSGLYCLRKEFEKWPSLDQNLGLTPFLKVSIFRPFKLFLYILERRFTAKHLSCLYCQKKVGKMAIFGPIAWVNPFGKISIFRVFELLVLIALKWVCSL